MDVLSGNLSNFQNPGELETGFSLTMGLTAGLPLSITQQRCRSPRRTAVLTAPQHHCPCSRAASRRISFYLGEANTTGTYSLQKSPCWKELSSFSQISPETGTQHTVVSRVSTGFGTELWKTDFSQSMGTLFKQQPHPGTGAWPRRPPVPSSVMLLLSRERTHTVTNADARGRGYHRGPGQPPASAADYIHESIRLTGKSDRRTKKTVTVRMCATQQLSLISAHGYHQYREIIN